MRDGGRIWAKIVGGFFSAFKGLFWEEVQGRKFERKVKEMDVKVWVNNLML